MDTTRRTLAPGRLAAAQVFVHLHTIGRGLSPDCTICTTRCCGVPLPPVGMVIKVTEPLEVCHPSSHSGLDEEKRLPPGTYLVTSWELGNTSHFIRMARVDAAGKKEGGVYLCAGYAHESLMDWRTCQSG